MDSQEKTIQDIIESDSKFREQFDRSSEIFHGGDPTPVPVGGQRVPESMKEGPQIVIEEQKSPDDPRYHRVMEIRSYLQEFKKVISLVCPHVEARLRAKGHKEQESREKLIQECNEKISSVLSQIEGSKEKIQSYSDYLGDYSADLEFILANSNNDYSSKDEYGEFMLKVSAFNKKIFKDIQNLLQVIKDIKRGKA